VKVTVERMPQSAVTLDIVAEDEEFGQAMERAFRKISRQVRIPGFRPGRAPRALIEQRIGREAIVDEAQREIMDGLYRQALEQEDLTPVSDPSVDVYQNEPVGFRVEVQVYPTVDLGDYTAVRLEPREVNVTDEDVQEVLEDLQKRHAIWKEPEEPRQPRDGDQVLIDLQAYEGDEPYQDQVSDATFEIGAGNLFPQIEEALRNMQVGGSAEFDITFGEDDEKISSDLHGRTLRYDVTLKELKERELPEIDDDLAKTAGEFETLDELRDAVRKDLLRSRAMQARSEVVSEAINALAEQATLDIPSAMVDRQIEDDLQRLRQELSREQMSLEEFLRFGDKTLEDYRDEIRPDAERRLRNSIVLDAFAKTEGLEVTEDDLIAEIDRLTAPSENPEQLREIYNSPYFQRMIMDELANRRLTDHLIELVTEGQGAVIGEGAEVLREAETANVETTEVTGEVAEAVADVVDEEDGESDSDETTTEEPAAVSSGGTTPAADDAESDRPSE
jgi:trigger factor